MQAAAAGLNYELSALTHMVLKVEQLLSTGGGWQDQVGGLWPCVKASSCPAALPVAVTVMPVVAATASSSSPLPQYPLIVSAAGDGPAAAMGAAAGSSADDALASFLDAHLLLIYTGKTRLAKNLLQRVLRQWAMRDNAVTQRVAALRTNAVTMAGALAALDAAGIGSSLSTYWEQKKGMAPMAEPAEAAALMGALRDHGWSWGSSLTGAGGGGFMVVVTRKPHARADVEHFLRRYPTTAGLDWSVHSCGVDRRGLTLHLGGGAAAKPAAVAAAGAVAPEAAAPLARAKTC